MIDRICRLCNHVESKHTGSALECGWIPISFTEGNIATFCPCFKFVPSDNLEYLELKVKQKESEKLSI